MPVLSNDRVLSYFSPSSVAIATQSVESEESGDLHST